MGALIAALLVCVGHAQGGRASVSDVIAALQAKCTATHVTRSDGRVTATFTCSCRGEG